MSTVKTRFLIISDTHNAVPSANQNATTAFRAPLPKADVLLHCGDLTMIGHVHEYEQTLSSIEAADAPLKLVIAGNHDISLDEEYYARRGQNMQRLKEVDPDMPRRAKEMWTGERARKAGVWYLEEGTYEFVLENGGKLRVYASPYQPEFCDFAFPYFRNQDRFNPPAMLAPGAVSIATNPIPDFPTIDVIMTHGPPLNILDKVPRAGENVGCGHLLRAAARCKPRLHCFGHIHEGWGAEKITWTTKDDERKERGVIEDKKVVDVDEERMSRGEGAYVDATGVVFGRETLMVNASIMTVRYQPLNAPWVVDLELEKVV